MPDIAVDDCRVRPVRLDRDNGKAVPLDQTTRDRGARSVDFGRPVRRFAQEDDPGFGEAVEKPPEGGIVDFGQRLAGFAYQFR